MIEQKEREREKIIEALFMGIGLRKKSEDCCFVAFLLCSAKKIDTHDNDKTRWIL
jgi:hypothetical protein